MFVLWVIPLRPLIRLWIHANNAISIKNAINVNRAAKNEINDETNVTVTWVEKLNNNATKDTAAATGRTASPLVQLDLMVISELFSPCKVTEYPWPDHSEN